MFIASNINYLVDSQKVILVFFIGGCTFAEISALRFLSSLEDCMLNNNIAHNINAITYFVTVSATTEYVIATTNIINGNRFLKSLISEINK